MPIWSFDQPLNNEYTIQTLHFSVLYARWVYYQITSFKLLHTHMQTHCFENKKASLALVSRTRPTMMMMMLLLLCIRSVCVFIVPTYNNDMSLKLDNKITMPRNPKCFVVVVVLRVCLPKIYFLGYSHPYEQIYMCTASRIYIREEYKDDSHNKLNYLHVTWSFTVHFIWFSIGNLSHTFIHFQSNFLGKKISMDVCLFITAEQQQQLFLFPLSHAFY